MKIGACAAFECCCSGIKTKSGANVCKHECSTCQFGVAEIMKAEVVNLEAVSGLPLRLNPGSNILSFGKGMEEVSPIVKYARDLKSVLMDQHDHGDKEVYCAYRGVSLGKDKELLRNCQLRYDVIVIPPGTLGREYAKTKGHEHEAISESRHTYPELYLVLYGQIHYLLQHRKKGGGASTVDDVLVIKASAGDKVLIPPDYAHFSINAGNQTAVIANIVGTNVSSLYGDIEKLHGAAYYLDSDCIFVRNKRYSEVPDLRHIQPRDYPDLGILKDVPAYSMLIQRPEIFKYLVHPVNYLDRLIAIY